MHQFVVLRFVGISPKLIGSLEEYVKSPDARISESVSCSISTEGKSEEFNAVDGGTPCLKIISAERDKIHETYTIKIIFITAFEVPYFTSAEEGEMKAKQSERFIIKPPESVLLGLMRALRLFPSRTTIDKVPWP